MSAPAIPQSDLRERILRKVRDSKKPVTFRDLLKSVKAKSEEPFRTELESAISEKSIYRWPDYRRSQYFWHIPPEEKAREAILEAAAAEALSKPDLSKAAGRKVPGFPQKRMENEVSALLSEERLQQVPAFASNTKLLVRAGDGQAYFNAARAFIAMKMGKAGFDPAAFFTGDASPQRKPALPHADAAARILEAILALEPQPGVPVSTLRLRNHLRDLSKQEFDMTALELRKKQEVFLSQHADPYNISQEDKDLLIDGQDGTYYVAIAIR
ncbi:MAG TPA: hypothetical protein VHZ07_12495 [Bryobacteraceae bacterium]|jgi:hypothetical protein|nr:hypothetical protein [Bryobacteraceae bacterium]